jgi:hypothetical protein
MTTLSDQEQRVNERRAKAFDSVLTFAQQKARFPLIREYCERILEVKFQGDHSYCPIHTGHGGHAFEITDSTQKWQCWGRCRDNCPRHGNDTIDYTQPCVCRGDVLDLHMLCFEFESKREAINSLINGDGKSLPRKADKCLVDGQPKLIGAATTNSVETVQRLRLSTNLFRNGFVYWEG